MNNNYLLLLPILIPIISGMLIGLLKMENRKLRQTVTLVSVVSAFLLTVLAVATAKDDSTMQLFRLTENITFFLKLDGLGKVFALLVSSLWVVTTFYAFGYMPHEGKEVKFYTFFNIVMGVVIGLAFAGNALTMYLFYEFLTLMAFPLITHTETPEAIAAGKKYLLYSFIGAIMAFSSIGISFWASGGGAFVMGGLMDGKSPDFILLWGFLFGFLGFGVKAAEFPSHGWLPSAYVAPTPVTALLHAVAVVKAGIFGVMRVTYYIYGADFIKGSWVHIFCLILTGFSIVYGSSMAIRTLHLKKRLAYSTISQLSYILFAIMMLSPAGLRGGVVHMVFHGVMKITLFFCCGSIMMMTDTTDVREMKGYGRKMPITFACFTIASLALVGLPPTMGLISKWMLATAAFSSGTPVYGVIGIVAIMMSTLLTGLYLLPLSAKAFFPGEGFKLADDSNTEASKLMTIPVVFLTILIIIFGLFPGLLLNFLASVGL